MSQVPSSASGKPKDRSPSEPPAVKKSKRGRRSTVPPEQREHVRRLKKQNMERRRRACIADKMNALHSLAMNLIGEDPAQYQKAEKADLLNMCYNVFEHLVNVVNDEPDVRLRVQRIMEQSKDRVTSQCISTPSGDTSYSLPTQNDYKIHKAEDKENRSSLLCHTVSPQLSLSNTHIPSGSQLCTPLQRQTFACSELISNFGNEYPLQHTENSIWNTADKYIPSPCTGISAQLSSVDSGIGQSDQSTQSYSIWNLTHDSTRSNSALVTRNPLSDSSINSFTNTNCTTRKAREVHKRVENSSNGENVLPVHSTPLWRPYLD